MLDQPRIHLPRLCRRHLHTTQMATPMLQEAAGPVNGPPSRETIKPWQEGNTNATARLDAVSRSRNDHADAVPPIGRRMRQRDRMKTTIGDTGGDPADVDHPCWTNTLLDT